MKQVLIAILSLTITLIVVMIALGVVAVVALAFALAWVAPVVGVSKSACERYPYTSGCR